MMSFGHALYYPHINLRSRNWLKCALLYWDKLSRIVPTGVDPEDSEDVIELRDKTDFIDDYSPEEWDVSNTFREFADYLDDPIISESFLRAMVRRQYRDYDYRHPDFRDRIFHDPDFRREVLLDVTRSSGAYIHVKKLDHRLKEKLYDLGLAMPGEDDWEDWVRVEGSFGYAYMTYLARSISDHHQFPMVTDLPNAFSDAIAFARKHPKHRYGDEFEYKIGHLLVAQFLPANLNSIPLSKLIEIRKAYRDQQNQFLMHIQKLCYELPTITSEKALADALRMHSERLCSDAQDLQKVYEAQHIDIATKFLAVSVPTSIASMTDFVPAEWKAFGLAAGLLFGSITAIRSVQKDRLALRKQPLSYLLHLQAETEPVNLVRRIMRRADGLLKW